VLRHAPQMRRLFVGEGIETVLSVWWALSQTGRLTPADGFWSSVDLGNLGGRAIGRVEHPTARIVDSKGRSRPLLVPDAAPDLDSKAIVVPEGVEEVFLLGDGDSDRFATELTLLRAARRTSLTCSTVKAVRLAWADDGADFNDMLEAA
ncbi:MAG: DUF7146 domain-containing protein, partial [Bradyrhizobium sp.]